MKQMKFDITRIVVTTLIGLLIGQMTWQTTSYFQQQKAIAVQEKSIAVQENQTVIIKESLGEIKGSLKSIVDLVYAHEARLRVNETHIQDLREKTKK